MTKVKKKIKMTLSLLQLHYSWFFSHISFEDTTGVYLFKGALSGLIQSLATESPLKMMINAFYFT